MKDVRLTRRGRIVVGIAVAVALVTLYGILSTMLTPEECRVSIEEMSEACRSLL